MHSHKGWTGHPSLAESCLNNPSDKFSFACAKLPSQGDKIASGKLFTKVCRYAYRVKGGMAVVFNHCGSDAAAEPFDRQAELFAVFGNGTAANLEAFLV